MTTPRHGSRTAHPILQSSTVVTLVLIATALCSGSAVAFQWKSLFNGADLTGWTPKITGYELGENFGETFRVEDGILKVSYENYGEFGGKFGHLFYEHPYANYRLRIEYRFTGEQCPGGPGWAVRNSGVMLHSQPPETMRVDQEFPVSIEAQFLGGDGQRDRTTANLCTPGTHVVMNGELVKRHCTNSTSETYHGDQWVTVDIQVRNHSNVRHFVNGELVLEYRDPQLDETDPDARELLGEGDGLLRRGYIALQSESHPVEFRKIEIALMQDESEQEAAVNEPDMRFIESNGIRMRIAEMGEGPLVLLVHGWPESWYSWRHQLPALADAGYHAVAPDMRGYGKTDAPEAIEDYDIVHLTDDVIGVLDALGEQQAVIVGHDWGALVAWNAVLLHPDRFRGLIAMSVPYGGRPAESPIDTWKRQFNDNFFYILYFQQPGVAEREFDGDPRGILSRLYLSPDSPREAPALTDPKMSAGGWIPRLGAPKGLPDWLTQEDLDYYVRQFTEAGFRGGINYYRNFDRNWRITPQLEGATIAGPVMFVAGEKDVVIRGATAEQLTAMMSRVCTDLRGVKLFPDAGHWVQQERPELTNEALIEFLNALER